MIYLLDTNILIAFLRDTSPRLRTTLASQDEREIVLCSVAIAELMYGAYRSGRRDKNLTGIERLQARFKSLPFDDRAARIYGQIRFELETLGTPIGPNDVLIASIAMANDLTLVTDNLREFQRIGGLKVANWL